MVQPVPLRAHALEQLLTIPEHERNHEVLAGELERRANPTGEHGAAAFAFGSALAPFGGRGGGDGSQPGGWWFASEADVELAPDTILRPDVLGWRRDRVPQRPRGFPIPERPDWVCEILSPGTAGRDRIKKARAYHLAKVPHYWIVDPSQRTLEVFRYTLEGYLLVTTAGPGERVRPEPFHAIELAIDSLFGED